MLVLGMHRSGTSCLAGALEACGVHLGAVASRAPHNMKGTRELDAVWRLNDDVLAANGGSWHAPPAELTWTAEHRARRDEILDSLAASRAPLLGIKDPRLLLTLDLWLEALPAERLRMVGSIREPAAVVRSLKARDGFSRRRSLRLWWAYNARLLALQDRRSDGIVDFSLPFAEYRRQVQAVAQRLELSWCTAADAFVDEALRHAEGTSRWTPARDRELYATLRRLAEASAAGSA